jgi:maltooligosyltrehalose trehalohydrolase
MGMKSPKAVVGRDATAATVDVAVMPHRRLPVGAEICGTNGAHFRVWAPRHARVHVVFENEDGALGPEIGLDSERNGYFSGVAPSARAGMRYRYRLGDDATLLPDPASRFQPCGPHGASEIVDPNTFVWTDAQWTGIEMSGQVVYEIHIGTFTNEGSWLAAIEQLPRLADLGVTTIEVMPVAEFPGRYGWGYDGVDFYAPSHLYGTPDDFRRFVDRAHALRLAVILDVVYNHPGPDGNYLGVFAREYFSTRHTCEWGAAFNFDGDDAAPVREWTSGNAGYWIDEFHLDGLRLDATQQMFDDSAEHVLRAIAARARETAGHRRIILVAENEPQDATLIRPVEQQGCGLDALWNDDFHHAAMVAVGGPREAYYTDYRGAPQEFVSLAKWGFLFQGQRYAWQRRRRGTPAFGVEPERFVTFLQNHDQVANAPSGRGERIHQVTSPALYRAMTAFWLLSPGTPMLFQGQEFCASSPFLFFADHAGDLGAAVRKGRASFMSQFPSLASANARDSLPDPAAEETFLRCKLRDDERDTHRDAIALHRDLLRLRREDRAFRNEGPGHLDGAVLGSHAFLLRFFGALPPSRATGRTRTGDRLLIVNLGTAFHFDPAPEPLLAPPEGKAWDVLWSSEHPVYGGDGTTPLDTSEGWYMPGPAAVVLAADT